MVRIMKYINRVYRASLIDRELAFADEGLAGQQLSYILQICRSPGISQDEIAKRLYVNKSSVTRQLCRMEKHGFIERKVDKDDKRAKKIYPTKKANEIYPKVIDYLNEWNENIITDIDEANYDNVVEILRSLALRSTEVVNEKVNTKFNDKAGDF